ncbi:MAG: hypothetical protein Q7U08_05755, partial [Flavobacteriaceae bacterium]|nr:hypothetical protein [Flavobacteriaceae bacterium]
MKQFGILLMTVVFTVGLMSFSVDQDKWVVPAKDKALKNPVEGSKENLNEAKTLYNLHCKSCHGAKGLGDGPKAKSMKGDLGDFSSADFHTQTDG